MYSASPVELGERAEGRQGWGVLGTWISAAFQTPCERQLDPEVDQENEGRGVSHSRWPHQGLSTLPTAHGRLCPGSDLLLRPAAHLALSFYQTGSLHPSLSPDPEPSGGGNWRFPVVELAVPSGGRRGRAGRLHAGPAISAGNACGLRRCVARASPHFRKPGSSWWRAEEPRGLSSRS